MVLRPCLLALANRGSICEIIRSLGTSHAGDKRIYKYYCSNFKLKAIQKYYVKKLAMNWRFEYLFVKLVKMLCRGEKIRLEWMHETVRSMYFRVL